VNPIGERLMPIAESVTVVLATLSPEVLHSIVV